MSYEEDRQEWLDINSGTASKELINKWISEREGIVAFYKEQSKKDKRPYWKGKIGHKVKEINMLKKMLKKR